MQVLLYQGQIQRFWKGLALYVDQHGWPKKKILGFRLSKKAKIALQTISSLQNISISILKFSPFLNTMKDCQWNLINFSKRFDKGVHIKYVGEGTGGFYNFFRKCFVIQETIDLNISWPSNFFRKYFMAPPINFSFF